MDGLIWKELYWNFHQWVQSYIAVNQLQRSSIFQYRHNNVWFVLQKSVNLVKFVKWYKILWGRISVEAIPKCSPQVVYFVWWQLFLNYPHKSSFNISTCKFWDTTLLCPSQTWSAFTLGFHFKRNWNISSFFILSHKPSFKQW